MPKKDKFTSLTREVFATDAGKLLLAELYLMYADNTPPLHNPIETGHALGKAELVKDLFRAVYGKKDLPNGLIDATMLRDDLDFYGE